MEEIIAKLPIVVVVLLLIVGFVLLIKGADFFVEGSASIAKMFKVPSVIIGLTIVAMGTSLPETAVSVTASMSGSNSLAISNAIGSNIFNLMVVIGVCSILTPIAVGEDTIKKDIPFSIFCGALLLVLGLLGFADASGMILGHLDGAILLVIFIAYLVVLVLRVIKARKEGKEVEVEGEPEDDGKPVSIPKSIIFIILGGAAIAFGGDLTVNSASRIALSIGMSETLVGLTIVSIGTSLPELVTSIVAARKNQVGMALGNAIGSNVFNIMMVLGIASAISPISFIQENVIDIIVLLVFSLIVWLLTFFKKNVNRVSGIIMLICYIGYSVYIFIR